MQIETWEALNMRQKAAYLAIAFALFLSSSALPAWGQVCTSFPKTVPLVSGTTNIGTVTIMNDATNLYVVLQATAPYTISQLNVQVGTSLSNIPQSSGNPQAGQFSNKVTFQPTISSFNYSLPLNGLRPGTPIVIATGAVVQASSSSSCSQSGHDGEDDDHHSGDDHHSSSSDHHSYSSSSSDHHDDHGDDHHGDDNHGDDHHGDDHHGDDHHGDDHHGDDHSNNCGCNGGKPTQLTAWGGTTLFPGNAGASYITYTVNCSNIE
jgi:hypothetical protein